MNYKTNPRRYSLAEYKILVSDLLKMVKNYPSTYKERVKYLEAEFELVDRNFDIFEIKGRRILKIVKNKLEMFYNVDNAIREDLYTSLMDKLYYIF